MRVDKAAAIAKDAAVAAVSSSSSNPADGIATSGPSSNSKGPQSSDSGSGLESPSSSKMKFNEGPHGPCLRPPMRMNGQMS